jgi:hypothetical protein
LVAWAKNIKISNPLEEGCRLGSVVSEGQVMLMKYITLVDVLLQICTFYESVNTAMKRLCPKQITVQNHDNSDDPLHKKLLIVLLLCTLPYRKI